MRLLKIIIQALLLGCSSNQIDKVFEKLAPEEKESNPININLDVKKTVLDNGHIVLVIENKHLPIFTYRTFYAVGSKYEHDGITGSSHFLEHMMFKGAKKFGPGVFDTLIESNGGKNNAYTEKDFTVYFESLPSNTLEKVIELESDRMNHLLLAPKDFETERNVILEERKVRYENSPRGQLFTTLFKDIFVDTPYESPSIGTIRDLKHVSRDQVQKYFKTFYAPNSSVTVVVGDVDHNRVFNLMEKYFGGIPRSKRYDEIAKVKNQKYLYHHRAKYGRHIKIKGETPNPMFAIVFKGEPLGQKRALVMDILASMIGSGNSSYLHRNLVISKRPILAGVYASNYNLQNNGLFILGGSLLKGVKINQFEKTIKRHFKKICDEAIELRTLEKTKNQFIVGYYNELETNSGLANFVGTRQAYLNDYDFYKKEIEYYQSIELADVKKVCHEIFLDDKFNLYTIWNKYPRK